MGKKIRTLRSPLNKAGRTEQNRRSVVIHEVIV